MAIFIIGVILFLGSHSVRIFADPWRTSMIERLGEKKWKGLYTLISLFGFIVLIIGYGQARQNTIMIWQPPVFLTHLAVLLNLFTFILLASSARNNNAIRLKLKHPMILGVKVWAIAHLLANGSLVDVILFGSFLIWAVLDFRSARNRPNLSENTQVVSVKATISAIFLGVVFWLAFIFGLHQWLIGVSPLAMISR
ncbi:hypothetical protein PSHI8_19540 [Polynucleobacter sp. SHI8]|uniref:NnrU family protein n=1 Tax=unclassified Polynucleobacter TaxID=2640945 RepID=UPI00248F8C15|nr:MULTISPECIES: NnrU family protein [unclassified Polynucleobacter]BDW11871.1 hypothetical protein PSHI2_19530 [Polynucleobacter sp. SHI2]BDW14318.1 hypothetical protein PSHI8_19540 [Polynucleobacter sp. SHI8]